MEELTIELFQPKRPLLKKALYAIEITFISFSIILVFAKLILELEDVALMKGLHWSIFVFPMLASLILFTLSERVFKYKPVGLINFQYNNFFIKDSENGIVSTLPYGDAFFDFNIIGCKGFNSNFYGSIRYRRRYFSGYNKLKVLIKESKYSYYFYIPDNKQKLDIEGFLLFLKETNKANMKVEIS